MSESKSFLRRVFSLLMDRVFEDLRRIVRRRVEAIIRLVVIGVTGLTLLMLGLLHLSLGMVRQLTFFLGEALAYGIVGLVFVLLGIVLLLLAMILR